jgi:hypothetical protein
MSAAGLGFTIGYNWLMWKSYYQPNLQLQEEQALKRPILILSVYPSTDFNMTVGFGNFIIKNTTYRLNPGSNVTFHIFLSNVGNSPTVATDLLFQYYTPNAGGESASVLNATILKPGDSHEWVLPFTVPSGLIRTSLTAQFAIVTTDGIVMKVVHYNIAPCC